MLMSFNMLLKKALNGKRTIGEAHKWLLDNYEGQTRKALKYQMYESTPAESIICAEVRMLLHDAIKLGYSKDKDLTNVFR